MLNHVLFQSLPPRTRSPKYPKVKMIRGKVPESNGLGSHCGYPLCISSCEASWSSQGGRVIIELFPDVTPRAVENFRGLCTGEYGALVILGLSVDASINLVQICTGLLVSCVLLYVINDQEIWEGMQINY